MQIGFKFPTREMGTDVAAIRDWAGAVASHGFSHISVIDHVLGADPEVRPEFAASWPMDPEVRKPYDVDTEFHEPMVLMGFLAALAPIELSTGVLIAPQRQTALLAKQAAEVDILTGGRLRLVIAPGWNPVEYEALGQSFRTRGRRLDEQIKLLRSLWTTRVSRFEGEFDTVVGAGIAPLPVQRPIPIWLGGFSPRAWQRVGELGDGWLGSGDPEASRTGMAAIRQIAEDAGRDPTMIGLEGTAGFGYEHASVDVPQLIERWREIGATHLTFDAMGNGRSPREHVDLVAGVANLVGAV